MFVNFWRPKAVLLFLLISSSNWGILYSQKCEYLSNSNNPFSGTDIQQRSHNSAQRFCERTSIVRNERLSEAPIERENQRSTLARENVRITVKMIERSSINTRRENVRLNEQGQRANDERASRAYNNHLNRDTNLNREREENQRREASRMNIMGRDKLVDRYRRETRLSVRDDRTRQNNAENRQSRDNVELRDYARERENQIRYDRNMRIETDNERSSQRFNDNAFENRRYRINQRNIPSKERREERQNLQRNTRLNRIDENDMTRATERLQEAANHETRRENKPDETRVQRSLARNERNLNRENSRRYNSRLLKDENSSRNTRQRLMSRKNRNVRSENVDTLRQNDRKESERLMNERIEQSSRITERRIARINTRESRNREDVQIEKRNTNRQESQEYRGAVRRIENVADSRKNEEHRDINRRENRNDDLKQNEGRFMLRTDTTQIRNAVVERESNRRLEFVREERSAIVSARLDNKRDNFYNAYSQEKLNNSNFSKSKQSLIHFGQGILLAAIFLKTFIYKNNEKMKLHSTSFDGLPALLGL